MQKLTDRQIKILECISVWLDNKGFPPSVREICAETGIKSTRGVTTNLDILENAGYIKRDATARSITLLTKTKETSTRMLPLMGYIAAGPPILADDSIERMVAVPEEFAPGNEDSIILKVRGESMQDEGIFDGDMVVVRRQPVAENGELVAVMIDGEATVKRFHRVNDELVRLEASNPAYEPIIIFLKDSQTIIVGKVVGLLRNYR